LLCAGRCHANYWEVIAPNFISKLVKLVFVLIFLEVNHVSKNNLQRFKPASQNTAQFSKAIDIRRVVVLLLVADVANELFGECVAVLGEGVVILAMPEVAEVNNQVVNFLH
jgi:hypothetical protein